MKNIAVLGGTFDPPHIGHLIIAEEVRQALSLDKVWFMPSYEPPHKEYSHTSSVHRLKMVELAISNNPFFSINLIETKRHTPSFTVDTMEELTKQHPETNFYFIIGADMVTYLPHWKDIERLLELVTFVGVTRAEYSLETHYPIEEVNVPRIDVSSSMLRRQIEKQKSVMYYLPSKVRQYIKEHNLYDG